MLRFLLEKEFRQIRRNPFLPRFILVFPFIALWLLPRAANFEVKNIRISIVDKDRGHWSRRLTDKVISSGYFRLVNACDGYAEALRDVELDKSDMIMEIPPRFGEKLVRDGKAPLFISANTVNGTKGGLGSSFLISVVNDFSVDLRSQAVLSHGRGMRGVFEVTPYYRYNPHLQYPVFMVPALMVMFLTMICGFLPALSIVGEKENGTMEQMNVTPVRRGTFILSKLIPYWTIGFAVFSVCLLVARIFYGLVPLCGIPTIYLFASVFVLAFSGLGLVISNLAKSVQQAMFLMFFFVVTCILMSGLYTPISSMPHWAQVVSAGSPLRYFIQVMRLGYLKGSGFYDMAFHFFVLCAFALFFNLLAVVTYKKSE